MLPRLPSRDLLRPCWGGEMVTVTPQLLEPAESTSFDDDLLVELLPPLLVPEESRVSWWAEEEEGTFSCSSVLSFFRRLIPSPFRTTAVNNRQPQPH